MLASTVLWSIIGKNASTGELLSDATSCSMCRRLVINSGLERVVIRKTPTEFEVVNVSEWVDEDDLQTIKTEGLAMDLK